MKKLIIIFAVVLSIVFVFSVSSVFAQYAYFGLKAGLSMATFHGKDTDASDWGVSDKKSRLGITAGVYSTIVLAKIFALQPEVLYTQKGALYTYTEAGFESTTKIKMDYVEIPLLFKFYIPMTGPVKINIFAGPEIAVNFVHKYKYEEETLGVKSYEEEGDINDLGFFSGGVFLGMLETTTLDYGAVFGAGAEFIVKGIQMSVEARYALGLAKSLDIAGVTFDVKNSALQILYGIGF